MTHPTVSPSWHRGGVTEGRARANISLTCGVYPRPHEIIGRRRPVRVHPFPVVGGSPFRRIPTRGRGLSRGRDETETPSRRNNIRPSQRPPGIPSVRWRSHTCANPPWGRSRGCPLISKRVRIDKREDMPREFRHARDHQVIPSPMALDRRLRTRQPNPFCRSCQADPDNVRATVRTGSRVFFKCERCGSVWDVEQPPRGARRR
jgi:hypothetical protein